MSRVPRCASVARISRILPNAHVRGSCQHTQNSFARLVPLRSRDMSEHTRKRGRVFNRNMRQCLMNLSASMLIAVCCVLSLRTRSPPEMPNCFQTLAPDRNEETPRHPSNAAEREWPGSSGIELSPIPARIDIASLVVDPAELRCDETRPSKEWFCARRAAPRAEWPQETFGFTSAEANYALTKAACAHRRLRRQKGQTEDARRMPIPPPFTRSGELGFACFSVVLGKGLTFVWTASWCCACQSHCCQCSTRSHIGGIALQRSITIHTVNRTTSDQVTGR